MPPSILIYGSGAMACLTAAHMAAAGNDVTMLDTWKDGIDALQNGVTLISPYGEASTYPVHAVVSPSKCLKAELTMVLVKSWQTAKAAKALALCLLPEGIAVTLQNGLGNLEVLQDVLGVDRVRTGSATFGATLLAPGKVRAAGMGMLTLDADPRINILAEYFSKTGIPVQRDSDMRSILWRKVIINAAINPLTALLEVPNGRLIHNSDLTPLIENLVNEATTVAAAEGILFSPKDIFNQVIAICTDTAANLSSMLQDIQRGAPTEVDAICGSLLNAADRHKIPTPTLRTLTHLIHARSALTKD